MFQTIILKRDRIHGTGIYAYIYHKNQHKINQMYANIPYMDPMGKLGLPSLKLTAKAPENRWLEEDPASFWGNFGLFSGVNSLFFPGGYVLGFRCIITFLLVGSKLIQSCVE